MSLPANLGALAAPCDPNWAALIAVPFDGADTVTTHGELDAMADAVARGLARSDVTRGQHVVILSANRPEFVACLLGALRAGAVATPVNFKFAPATIAHILAETAAAIVFCDAPRRADLAALATTAKVVCFDDAQAGGFAAWLDPGAHDAVVPHADDVALCLYTSGSTGPPKGVLLSHAAHLWVVERRLADDDIAAERLLIAAPLYHMNALALTLLVCAAGATAVMMPQFQAAPYIAAIGRHHCTWLTAVPPMIAMMLQEKAALDGADLSSVHTLRLGSAPVNDMLAAQTRALLPNARIINAYGTTEGGPIVFTEHPGGLPLPSGALGVPHPGVAVRLVGAEAPDKGVLQLKSPAIMRGYLNRLDVASPITSDGYYSTGDVFRRDESGFFFFIGRTDDMFVSGGENIFPGEVESVLESHPDVLQACVVPIDDDIKGTKPIAFVVRRPGNQIDEDALKRHVLANAPAYQHPRRIWFLEQMPLAATNKIDRTALRRRAEAAVSPGVGH